MKYIKANLFSEESGFANIYDWLKCEKYPDKGLQSIENSHAALKTKGCTHNAPENFSARFRASETIY
jgi:hypothetical protein